jgi:hypothetical protein
VLSGTISPVRHHHIIFLKLKQFIMEKFMLIFHGGDMHQLSPEEAQQNMGKWMAWIDQLAKDGKYVAGEPLIPGGKLVSGKNKTVSDGPYAEGKEVVGGFFIVNAADMDEAVEISKGCPDFETGTSVQVRQVMKM